MVDFWTRPITGYHFAKKAKTQAQFAFQQNYLVFRQLLKNTDVKRILEVGCGRGSMGAYFADDYDVSLLDMSYLALQASKRFYARDGISGKQVNGDAFHLPYEDDTFDAVFSIGLLEHFDDVDSLMKEQIRVTRPGGMMICYIVPKGKVSKGKSVLYRNRLKPDDYLAKLSGEKGYTWLFPFPLVSRSSSFPYTPMSPLFESAVLVAWRMALSVRGLFTENPWICKRGQAFIVWNRRKNGEQLSYSGGRNHRNPGKQGEQ